MPREIEMSMDEARALVADQALWPRVRDFLWDFAPQIHRSWLEGIGIETIDPSLVFHPSVKRHILSSLGVSPCFHSFPKDDWSRLLLLDGATLGEVAKWLGALACAGDLRRVTDGATVRALKAALPGVYPEVFGYTMYFKMFDSQRRAVEPQGSDSPAGGGRTPAVEDVVSTGLSMFVSLLETLPDSLVSRLKLKLPKSFINGCVMVEVNPEAAKTALARLLKLKFPEAYKLCC